MLAEILSRSKTITTLSVERNDLRESGCLALVEALRGNTTLKELRFNHQRFVVSSRVEEALHDIMHGGHNKTLLKLGLVIRGDIERNRIEAVLMKNIDEQRVARHREATRTRGASTSEATSASDHGAGAGAGADAADGTTKARRALSTKAASSTNAATPVRQLSKKLSGIAMGLESTLAPFDADGLIDDLLRNHVPPGSRGPAGELTLCLNNDTKFVRCSTSQKDGIIQALARETCTIHTIEFANLQLSDASAQLFSDVLRANKSVKVLNLEGNRIGSSGISAIASALAAAKQLTELKLDHQVGDLCSAQAEAELARAIDQHSRLVKVSFRCRNIQSRDLVDRALMRNRDRNRLHRQSTKKLLAAGNKENAPPAGADPVVIQMV